jgi:tetratricopeptide (TPR) repeat protein
LKPNDRKIRPRRIRKYIKITKGQNEYTYTAQFKEPPPPTPPSGGNGGSAGNNSGTGGGAVTPPPPPRPSGNYVITVTSNAAGIKVYKGYRYLGTIRDAGGSLQIKHKDRRRSPRKVKLKFVAVDRYKYKVRTQRETVTISTSQETYSVNATFEVRPPIVIKASANVPGIRVSMNRKAQGVINDANSPLELKYTGRPVRSIRIDFKSTTKGVKPRGRRKYVRIRKGVYEYTVSATFKAPAAPPPPPSGGNTGNGGALPPPPPPLGSKFDGIYKITVTSNAGNVRVYRGRRSVGTIRSAGGSIVVKYKTKSKRPSAQTIVLKPRSSKGWNESKLTRKVTLIYGQAEYTVQGNFTAFEAAKIMVKANIPGVLVKLNRRSYGKIINTAQPLEIPYKGRRARTLTVELRSPNAKLYTPSRIRKKIKFDPSVKSYNVVGTFQERIVDTPITPRCFRRKRGLATVTVYASSGTRIVLKGECDEAVGKANKKGRIRIKMPKGTFQRVVAFFANGSRRQVVKQISNGLAIRFTTGSKACNIRRIKAKIRNKIRLENEEVACLKKVKRQDRQYFSARVHLARFFCQMKVYGNGYRELEGLRRIPQFYFNPYNAMAMGIEYGRCRKYFKAIRVLKQAERSSRKFAAADRRANMKRLLRAMADIYERRYYRSKNITDLRQAHKRYQRYYEMLRSSERSERSKARKEVARLRSLISKKGGGLDD